MSDLQELDVCVVGAGPAGLTMARRLSLTGARFEIFERNSDVGGIWDIDVANSPMYESAHFISSKTLSGFPGFPMPDEYPDYPNHAQILAYIRSFADHFDLRKHVKFNTSIEHASQADDGLWELQLSDGTQRVCRYLVCANGVTWVPNEVSWPGEFNGVVRHSVTYRSHTEVRGKRVLVVGAGNSGVDIACDAAFAADQAFLSLRRGYHFIPKHVFGKPADRFAEEGPKLPNWLEIRIFTGLLRFINGDITRLGLPKPDHELFASHPIMNTQILHYLAHGDCIAKAQVKCFEGDDVVFVDGSREQVDLVITATGYKHACPYLDEGTLDMQGGRPDLYLGMFSRKHANLAVLGFVEFASAAYSRFDEMAQLIVADATAEPGSFVCQSFAELKAKHRPNLQGMHHYIDSERHSNYVEIKAYLKTLAQVRNRLGLKLAVKS